MGGYGYRSVRLFSFLDHCCCTQFAGVHSCMHFFDVYNLCTWNVHVDPGLVCMREVLSSMKYVVQMRQQTPFFAFYTPVFKILRSLFFGKVYAATFSCFKVRATFGVILLGSPSTAEGCALPYHICTTGYTTVLL